MLRKRVWTNLQEEVGDFGVLVKLIRLQLEEFIATYGSYNTYAVDARNLLLLLSECCETSIKRHMTSLELQGLQSSK
jgi:hypothetical protein